MFFWVLDMSEEVEAQRIVRRARGQEGTWPRGGVDIVEEQEGLPAGGAEAVVGC